MTRGGQIIIDRVFAPGASGRAWARAISAWVRAGEPGRVLKCDGPHVVVAASMFGRAVVVKRWHHPPWTRFRSGISGSKSERHWRGAAWLTRHSIDTAPCLAMAHDATFIARRDYLIMEQLVGPTVLDVLAGARRRDTREGGHAGEGPFDGPRTAAGREDRASIGVRDELAIARAIGRQAARLIGLGRFNRDHKPSNLIVVRRSGGMRVAVIDCVAILPLSRGGGAGEAMERMLASLVIEPLGLGVSPRRSLILAALRGALELERGRSGGRAGGHGVGSPARRAGKGRVRGLWLSIAARVSAHGDPTPRVRPLG